MGIDQWVKRTLHHRYPAGFEEPLDRLASGEGDRQQATKNSTPLPPAQVYLFDATNRLKYFPKPAQGNAPITTGYDYWDEHICRDIKEAFESGAHSVYLCYDRGSPEIKSIEHHRRYRNTVFMEEPPIEEGPLVTHMELPPIEQWEGFVNHPQLRYDLMAYLTHAFLDEFDKDGAAIATFGSPEEAAKHTFIPPPNTCVFLHGGTLQGREAVRHVRDLPPQVFFVENSEVPPSQEQREKGGERGEGGKFPSSTSTGSYAGHRQRQRQNPQGTREYKRRGGYLTDSDVPERHVMNLLEGEQACVYYGNRRHPHETCCFVSSDGDMLLMLLLLSRDRIDPDTGLFRNRHLLVLRMSDGDDEVVDINRLYDDMMEDPVFKRAGVADPVLALVALGCLVKNDYIHGFAPGIGHETMMQLHKRAEEAKKTAKSMWQGDLMYGEVFRAAGWPPSRVGHHGQLCPDPSLRVPYVWALAFEQPTLLRNLVRVVGPRGNSQQPVNVKLNETAFIAFVEALYVKKHGPSVAKKTKCALSTITFKAIKTELQQPNRSPKNHPMPRRIMRRFARQLLWVLRYWLNGARGECITESPFAEYMGLPYYGWQTTSTGCISVERVSVVLPSDRWPEHEVVLLSSSSSSSSSSSFVSISESAIVSLPIETQQHDNGTQVLKQEQEEEQYQESEEKQERSYREEKKKHEQDRPALLDLSLRRKHTKRSRVSINKSTPPPPPQQGESSLKSNSRKKMRLLV